jgi:DNA helicase-2/ATP-dependent DNA helicase PcrA
MVTKEFEVEYKKLNPKQKEAVDSIEGPVMVIAGPGTGKTTILTLRIANILKLTDTPPSGILALTFTDAGVRAMRQKLRELIGETALLVPIHTFHGFAASVIAEFQDHFPHLSRSKQITDIEAETVIRDILKQKEFSKLRPLGEPDFYVNKILSTISDAKSEAWTPEIIGNFAKEEIERIKKDPEAISSRGATKGNLKGEALRRIEKCERTILFSRVYSEYEKRKREERKIDFDDLIFEMLKALREDKLLLQILQEKFLYILVDEHQDTNDAQNLIVRIIADFFEYPNLFVVGDEKQAIYRFQGASVENFLAFQKIWGQMKVISLEDNYRSNQNILDASFKMIEENYNENEYEKLRIKLKAQKGKVKPVDLVVAPNIETEESYLVTQLQELTKKDPDKTTAIIVRKNSDVSKILRVLEEHEIKASAERGTNIFTDPTGLLLFSLLNFLGNPSEIEALAETFALGLWNLNFAQKTKLIKLARSGDITAIEKEVPEIAKIQKEISNSHPIEYLSLVAELSGFVNLVSKDPLRAQVWHAIFELTKELVTINQIEDPKEMIRILLNHQKSAERKVIKIKTGLPGAQITVMTAHSSKGLEFDYVFLPYTVEESWLSRARSSSFVLPREKEDEDDIKDERRLFYVALTRAREHLVISFSLSDNLDRSLTPLRFIDELEKENISENRLATYKITHQEKSLERKEKQKQDEKIEYTKRTLLENGLSVTALNHFLNCPNEFFYKSILKLPEPPSASSEKGNAMHEALSRVWQRRGEQEIEQVIKNTTVEYLKNSLLPKFEKEVILEELILSAPKVALALTNHFKQGGIVRTESWVERYFPHQYKNEKIEIRLHGKLDTLIETEKELLVFDYKTREAMSENAIRGNTKDGDGGYFRQLIFYKMLLSDNSQYTNKKVNPALVFVKPDAKGRCPTIAIPIEESDVKRVESEIVSLIESVWSGDLLNQTCDDPECKYCKY